MSEQFPRSNKNKVLAANEKGPTAVVSETGALLNTDELSLRHGYDDREPYAGLAGSEAEKPQEKLGEEDLPLEGQENEDSPVDEENTEEVLPTPEEEAAREKKMGEVMKALYGNTFNGDPRKYLIIWAGIRNPKLWMSFLRSLRISKIA